MDEVIRLRLLFLVGLSILGVGIAGAGTTLWAADPLATTGANPEFVVGDENVTFANGGESETVVHNVSNLSRITIRETDTGRFSIQTTEHRPLSATDRERAREIALNNSTVATGLDEIGEYELAVEPIQRLTVSDDTLRTYNVTLDNSSGQSDTTFTINETSVEERQSDSVTISRGTNYVADSAVVRIRQPGDDGSGELLYVVDVDLSTERVTDVTDWRSI
ncbi:hypothetical protein [Haloarcula onubensis]|nr:hypothetical protein [Halomicroarcula sp. S3CR25-11]